MALTLYEKIFNRHVVEQLDDAYLIYIDRHLVHEVTSPQAFEGLRVAQRPIWLLSLYVFTNGNHGKGT